MVSFEVMAKAANFDGVIMTHKVTQAIKLSNIFKTVRVSKIQDFSVSGGVNASCRI